MKSSPDVAKALFGLLPDENIEYAPERIEAELKYGEAQPDLTVHDSDGRPRIFVENKFWAGLTDAQPVSYLKTLKKLSKGHPSALMFIVPEQRMITVWNELAERCKQAELKHNDARNEQGVIWNRIGCRIMLITSWRYVLERLLDAGRAEGNENIKHDILQLQGLASREDLQAFLPLRADEVTDQEAARRMMNYSDLIPDITRQLVNSGVADTTGLRPAHNYHTAGRYLRLHGELVTWLGVDLRVWHKAGITPLWLWLEDDDSGSLTERLKTNPEISKDVEFYNGEINVPIRLKTSVERERIMEDAATQIKRIADYLLEIIPDS